jgi:hypothetical protein
MMEETREREREVYVWGGIETHEHDDNFAKHIDS